MNYTVETLRSYENYLYDNNIRGLANISSPKGSEYSMIILFKGPAVLAKSNILIEYRNG